MYRLPVIFDVDTGMDDALALCLACAHDELDIKAVCAGHGNNTLAHTLRNTLNVMKLWGRPDVPVGRGADRPLAVPFSREDDRRHNGHFIHGVDGLCGLEFPFEDTTEALSELPAWDLMHKVLTESTQPVVICCLGALTNVALLLQKYPEDRGRIQCFVNMGGYVRNGNMSPMSSANIFYDAAAADIVFASGIPFYMCPGDLTGYAMVLEEELPALEALTSVQGRAVACLLREYHATNQQRGLTTYKGMRGLSLHDPCAVAFLLHPEFFTYGRYYCRGESQSELCIAMTVIDYEDTLKKPREEKNLFFVDSIDRAAFSRFFFTTLQRYERGTHR